MQGDILFLEIQKFTQTWIWVLLSAATVVTVVSQYVSLRRLPATGSALKRRVLLVLPLCLLTGVWALMLMSRLETKVRPDGLFVRFVPFQFRQQQIDLKDVTSVQAVQVSPVTMYGGWGMRFGAGGRAYLVSGNDGVRIDYRDGRHLFIGSAKAEQLQKAIETIHPSNGSSNNSEQRSNREIKTSQ